ncbi:MAG: helix-turn-helix transcriptional regulator [Oscillospiraceae bacterium]|nr:helix-turn-helix transcriptional regulator [Oscillospiraceae bacterium]
MSIGTNIREIRKGQNLRQVDLAAKAKVEQVYISNIENNRFNDPGVFRVKRIAAALNCSIERLLEGVENE